MKAILPKLDVSFPILCNSIEDVRQVFRDITPVLQRRLEDVFSPACEVEVDSLADTAAALELYGNKDQSSARILQTFNLFDGWRRGSELSLVWDVREPAIVRLKARAESKLEARALYFFTFGPGTVLAVLGLISARARLLRMLIFGGVGFIGGLIAYALVAGPILGFINRSYDAANSELALKAHGELFRVLTTAFKERRTTV